MPVRESGVIFAHPQFAKYPVFPDSPLILPPEPSWPALWANHEAQGRMPRVNAATVRRYHYGLRIPVVRANPEISALDFCFLERVKVLVLIGHVACPVAHCT